jgi:hypothetical protein
LLIEQVMQVAAFLVRPQKGDGDFAAGADLAFEAFAGGERICFPGRRESVRGGFGKNFLFFTPRKTNIAPLAVRMTGPELGIASLLVTRRRGTPAAGSSCRAQNKMAASG